VKRIALAGLLGKCQWECLSWELRSWRGRRRLCKVVPLGNCGLIAATRALCVGYAWAVTIIRWSDHTRLHCRNLPYDHDARTTMQRDHCCLPAAEAEFRASLDVLPWNSPRRPTNNLVADGGYHSGTKRVRAIHEPCAMPSHCLLFAFCCKLRQWSAAVNYKIYISQFYMDVARLQDTGYHR